VTDGEHAEARATSVDGRRFSCFVPPDRLDVATGGYAVLEHESGRRLGQLTAVELAHLEAGHAGLARIEGSVLDGPAAPFHDARLRVAREDEVADWLTRVRPQRATLHVGRLAHSPGLELALDAGAFDRHTFLCGQSGSGKTYALGTILERLLVETSLRIVVLDPNSDFVRLGEARSDIPDDVREGFGRAAAAVTVRRGAETGGDRLHVRFRYFDADEQAAVLRLDPIADRDEYAALTEAVERAPELLGAGGSVRETIDRMWAHPDPLHSLAVRARNLRVDRWGVWSGTEDGSLQDLVQPGGPRCIVADLGSLPTREEQAVAAESVLAALWRRRSAREPVLIVIDEAHNVCPGASTDPLTAMATEHAVRIAGEGRKFGLVLLVATQRPQKVHENVISQCDNLVLMRMNSRSDLAVVSEIFSYVPDQLLRLATDFQQGEAIVAGKLVPGPTVGRFGPRWSVEGGADVPSDWAAPR
jgi:DNA helicase HerA-like ATPase